MKRLFILLSGIIFSLQSFAQGAARSSSHAELDINGVRAMLLNGGDMFWDQGGAGDARYEVPKVDDPDEIKHHALFAAALWVGGMDASNGNVLVTAQTYRQSHYSYWPGPIVQNQNSILPAVLGDEASYWDKHFKVNKSVIDTFQSQYYSGKILSVNDIPDEIVNWPAKNNPYINRSSGSLTVDFNRELAPFYDIDNDGDYDPMKGDYPDIPGDQSIWWVMNDVGNQKVFGNVQLPKSDGIGLEVQVEAFAFDATDALKYVTFQNYKLINKGGKTLNDTYVGIWVDTELGNYIDDYIGCDTTRNLGYTYNGDDNDDGVAGYGQNVPAIGVSFCNGILADNDGIDNDKDGTLDELGEEMPMTNFVTYQNDFGVCGPHNPTQESDFYNYLRSRWCDNTFVTHDPNNGTVSDDQSNPKVNYVFSGNPITGEGWTELSANHNPGDRRFLMSMGPFTFNPGEIKEFTIGIPFAMSTLGALDALEKLFDVTDDVEYACKSGFRDYYGVKEKSFQKSFGEVFPTYVEDHINIELKQNGNYQFEIINSLGAIVHSEMINNSTQISLSQLESGIYLYRIIGSNGVQSGKIVKN